MLIFWASRNEKTTGERIMSDVLCLYFDNPRCAVTWWLILPVTHSHDLIVKHIRPYFMILMTRLAIKKHVKYHVT